MGLVESVIHVSCCEGVRVWNLVQSSGRSSPRDMLRRGASEIMRVKAGMEVVAKVPRPFVPLAGRTSRACGRVQLVLLSGDGKGEGGAWEVWDWGRCAMLRVERKSWAWLLRPW